MDKSKAEPTTRFTANILEQRGDVVAIEHVGRRARVNASDIKHRPASGRNVTIEVAARHYARVFGGDRRGSERR